MIRDRLTNTALGILNLLLTWEWSGQLKKMGWIFPAESGHGMMLRGVFSDMLTAALPLSLVLAIAWMSRSLRSLNASILIWLPVALLQLYITSLQFTHPVSSFLLMEIRALIIFCVLPAVIVEVLRRKYCSQHI